VDALHQVIVAADVLGSGSEQAALLPMIEQAASVRGADTLVTADAGYHSNENIEALRAKGVAALIADNQMRKRDERFAEQAKHKAAPEPLYDKRANAGQSIKPFRPQDFEHDPLTNTCRCPAGKAMYSDGSNCTSQGRMHHRFAGSVSGCVPCELRARCLRHPERTKVRQVAFFAKGQASPHEATELMKRAIDSPKGRQLYSQRIGTVEPVFANIRHNKRMNRFTLRGLVKVNTQWHLFCLVHNIEKIAGAQRRGG
jgi:IS5 family transposase